MICYISKFDTSISGLLSSTEDVSKMPKKISDFFVKSMRPSGHGGKGGDGDFGGNVTVSNPLISFVLKKRGDRAGAGGQGGQRAEGGRGGAGGEGYPGQLGSKQTKTCDVSRNTNLT